MEPCMRPSHTHLEQRRALLASLGLALPLAFAGCGALPDKPARATLYDFGPGPLAAGAEPAAPSLPPVLLADVDAQARLDGTQILYRLVYGDGNELRPYGQSRWSMAPTQLLRDRVRDGLALRRVVLGPDESANVARVDGRLPLRLHLTLDEFCQYFESPASSYGLVRVRATLLAASASGDRVVGQRGFSARQAAPSADAPGGVKALALASDALVAQLVQWVDTLQAQQSQPAAR